MGIKIKWIKIYLNCYINDVWNLKFIKINNLKIKKYGIFYRTKCDNVVKIMLICIKTTQKIINNS